MKMWTVRKQTKGTGGTDPVCPACYQTAVPKRQEGKTDRRKHLGNNNNTIKLLELKTSIRAKEKHRLS